MSTSILESTTPHIHLLFGFLGSGKTTLVRNLLHSNSSDIPTAVIVNEFGEVGIDGEIIQGNTIDTVELVSGCICCTLRGSLLNAIEELAHDKGAQRIIVEATGVADPSDMLDDFEDPSVVDDFQIAPLVTVVDTSKFNKIRTVLGEFYESQVVNADIIILNKIDLSDVQTLNDVTEQIKALNQEAEILFSEHCDVESSYILSDRTKLQPDSIEYSDDHNHHDHSHNHAHSHNHDHTHDHDHEKHPDFESYVVESRADLSRADLEKYCENLPDNVWRMKGHIRLDGQPALMQYAAGQLEITEATERDFFRIVVIGQRIRSLKSSTSIGTPINPLGR